MPKRRIAIFSEASNGFGDLMFAKRLAASIDKSKYDVCIFLTH